MRYLLYIDPGSGSFLAQALGAIALGIVFFFRNIKNYIRSIFHRTPKEPKDNPPA